MTVIWITCAVIGLLILGGLYLCYMEEQAARKELWDIIEEYEKPTTSKPELVVDNENKQ